MTNPEFIVDIKYAMDMEYHKLLAQNNGNLQAALFDAAKNNYPWAIPRLIQLCVGTLPVSHFGANVLARSIKNRALMIAADHGHLIVVAQLIAAKAQVNATGREGQTPLTKAASHGHGAVISQLIAANARVNTSDNYGDTALINAAYGGRVAATALLLAANARVNACDNDG